MQRGEAKSVFFFYEFLTNLHVNHLAAVNWLRTHCFTSSRFTHLTCRCYKCCRTFLQEKILYARQLCYCHSWSRNPELTKQYTQVFESLMLYQVQLDLTFVFPFANKVVFWLIYMVASDVLKCNFWFTIPSFSPFSEPEKKDYLV